MRVSLPVMAKMERTDLAQINEAEFQQAVRSYAEDRGWLVHMISISATRTADGKGWRGMGPKGWPDLACVRNGQMVAIELKAEWGSPSPEQRRWIQELDAVEGITARIFKPRDATEVIGVLE